MKPYYQRDGITIYHGDAREILPEIPTARLVVTDPPYVFGIASTSNEGKAGGWGDMMNAAIWYESWLIEVRRITRNSGAVWVFNSWRSLPVLAKAAMSIRWPIESLLVWDKEWIGPGGPRGLRPSYELAALFVQDGFALENRSLPDIWRQKWAGQKPTGHAAEKPVALLRRMIRESGGGRVLDPFMGSGSTLVAAQAEHCEAIGIECDERWCEMAASRLSQGVLNLYADEPSA